VAIADKMVSEVCTGCHNSRADTPKNDWRLGDVRGVLEARSNISKPLASGQAAGLTIVGARVAVLLGGLYWTD
jgi:methyl-accepting chemotaxis protein